MVITEDSASDRLLTASKITAMEPLTSPTAALNATKSTLAAIPTTLVLTITFSRSGASGALSVGSFAVVYRPFRQNVTVSGADVNEENMAVAFLK